MKTLEELKAIRDNAPEGANYVTLGGKQYIMIDGMHCKVFNCLGVWSIPVCNASDILIDAKVCSLSDINRIIELLEINEVMHKQVSYLIGEDWQHWQDFNKSKFEVMK